MATIDGFYITVESEDPTFEVDVTEQPVEKGINLVDHVRRQPRTIGLSGLVTGADVSKIRAYLISSSEAGKVVKYLGRNAFNGIITGLSTGHTFDIANGFKFSLTLREVRIASASPVSELPAPVRSQAAPIINAGTKQTKSKSKSTGKKSKAPATPVKFKAGSPWG